MKTNYCIFFLFSIHLYTTSCHEKENLPALQYEKNQHQEFPHMDRNLFISSLRSLNDVNTLRQRYKQLTQESYWQTTRKNFQRKEKLSRKQSISNVEHAKKDIYLSSKLENTDGASILSDTKKTLPSSDESKNWNKMRLEWMNSNLQTFPTEMSDTKVMFNWNQWILNLIGIYYLPSRTLEGVTEQCKTDVNSIYTPAKEQSLGSIAMVDSWGKIPDGLLAGNTFVMGSFDECLTIHIHRQEATDSQDGEGSFKGKYCVVLKTNFNLNISTEGNGIPNIAPSSMKFEIPYSYVYGTCMPSSCSEEDLEVSLNEIFEYSKNDSFGKVYCQTEDSEVDFDAGLIAMTVVLSIFGFLLIIGAVIDVWIEVTGNDDLRKGNLKYILVFSFYTNLQKMFHINTSENKEIISCLNGIRVLSMTWVVWGHQYVMTTAFSGNSNMAPDVFNDHWLVLIITNAMPSVDTFFFMSGLLVSYGILKEKERTGKINIIVFYIHRFLRLSIPIALAAGFFATYSVYLGHGPFAGLKGTPGSLDHDCREYWWRDVLFISNFNAGEKHCLSVTWYTSVDFQLFIVTPIILMPFIWGDSLKLFGKKKYFIGLIWLCIVTTVSCIIPGVIAVVNQLPPSQVIGGMDHEKADQFNEMIYFKAWCRASPYLVGIGLGILLRLDKKRKIHLQWWQVVIGWVLAIIAGTSVVFGMYDYSQLLDDPGYHWADTFFYSSFHTLAWGLALAWIVFACQYGYAGPVNSILSHPSWQPLSRLTYCMFLLAFDLQFTVFFDGYQTPYYFSHLNEIIQACGMLFIAGVGAIPLSLISEAPVLGLEKIILRKDIVKVS